MARGALGKFFLAHLAICGLLLIVSSSAEASNYQDKCWESASRWVDSRDYGCNVSDVRCHFPWVVYNEVGDAICDGKTTPIPETMNRTVVITRSGIKSGPMVECRPGDPVIEWVVCGGNRIYPNGTIVQVIETSQLSENVGSAGPEGWWAGGAVVGLLAAGATASMYSSLKTRRS